VSDEFYSGVFAHELTVREDVIDENGHVNNVVYVQWMQDVAILHFTALGGAAMMARHGAAWVARSHQIEYLRPAFAGEALVVKTWIADMERVKSLRRYEFSRGAQILARGATDWVFVDAETGRPKRIPDEMKDAVRK
jgi:acyl-CoA thioester hydrolase